jgi:hypothetical protein
MSVHWRKLTPGWPVGRYTPWISFSESRPHAGPAWSMMASPKVSFHSFRTSPYPVLQRVYQRQTGCHK